MSNDRQKLIQASPWSWVHFNQIQLHSGPWAVAHHEYQVDLLNSQALVEYWKKGSQMGFTEIAILWGAHGCLYGKFPTGLGVVFPTGDSVNKYSKERWGPMISLNWEAFGKYVSGDSAEQKKVGRATIHFRGAKETHKIEGSKGTSIQAKQWSADALIFDEKDEMAPNMVAMMLKRIGHAKADGIPKRAYIRALSTPSIPGWGIEKDYEQGTQHVWMIKCTKCNKETCLDLAFPDCLHQASNGDVIRLCPGCRQAWLNPRKGYWVAQYEKRDIITRWISRLNTNYADLKMILDCYQFPHKYDGGLQELYNSELARGYVASENKLETEDVYDCCSWDALQAAHKGPTCVGVDVGKQFHVTVATRPADGVLKIIYLARVSEIEDVREICLRFNAGCVVMDLEPETRTARRFQKTMDIPVWLCDEQGTRKKDDGWYDDDMLLSVNRTEKCDMVVQEVRTKGMIILPRRCEEVAQFALELSNIVKAKRIDKLSGSVAFYWNNMGRPDHYFHSLLFCIMASDRVPVVTDKRMMSSWHGQQQTHAETGDRAWDEQIKGE